MIVTISLGLVLCIALIILNKGKSDYETFSTFSTGTSETGEKNRAASMRSCIEVDSTDNATSFLEQIGFTFDHETILRGYLFKKGPMKICVSRLHKIPEKGKFQNAMQMTDSYLVEVTLNTLVQQDALCDEMKNFADYLKPIVVLDKLEQKRGL